MAKVIGKFEMLYFRIFLILYILPLMFLTMLALLFDKLEWIRYVWLYGTFAILLVIILVKILFCILSLTQ